MISARSSSTDIDHGETVSRMVVTTYEGMVTGGGLVSASGYVYQDSASGSNLHERVEIGTDHVRDTKPDYLYDWDTYVS